MVVETDLMRRLRLATPVIQAPMAGGGDTPSMVAAVGEAGGFGFVGAAYLTPDALSAAAEEIRRKSDRPFGINLFAPSPAPEMPPDAARAVSCVAPYYEELGLPEPAAPAPPVDRFAEQVAAMLDSGAAAFSYTFGVMPDEVVAAAKARGMLVMGTASTVAEALELERSGVDVVIAQGSEAGGHRATFLGDAELSAVGTMALVPQIVDAVSLPVIASGGIMDGRGIAAALALGAQAVQMGTAFLTTDEAGIPDVYKTALSEGREDRTRLTRAFSGRAARGISNRFMEEVDAAGDILPFPIQNALTRPMRTAAGTQGNAEFLSLWAGQGIRLARPGASGDLVRRLAAETDAAIARLGALV